ncbi:hypothetical protein PENTCL1PPCAC_13313, partial [Pristionchus entomophagus]
MALQWSQMMLFRVMTLSICVISCRSETRERVEKRESLPETASLVLTTPSIEGTGVIEEKVSSTPGPLFIQSQSLKYGLFGPNFGPFGTRSHPLAFDWCIGGHEHEYVLENGLDMRLIMGRWFEGLTSTTYHRILRKFGHKCMVYEFGRLNMADHTRSFDVIITYKRRTGNTVWVYGYMNSTEPRDAMLRFSSSWADTGEQFWIYKVG